MWNLVVVAVIISFFCVGMSIITRLIDHVEDRKGPEMLVGTVSIVWILLLMVYLFMTAPWDRDVIPFGDEFWSKPVVQDKEV